MNKLGLNKLPSETKGDRTMVRENISPKVHKNLLKIWNDRTTSFK